MAHHILLIEDDADDVLLLSRFLENLGSASQLETAFTLQAGLTRLASFSPDVILLDLFLPDSRGLETFQRVHDQHAHLPIIVLTGHSDEELGVDALKIGAQDFLTKGDITSPILARSMRYAIERHRLLMLLEQRRDETERQALYQLANHQASPVTADSYGEQLLEEGAPAIFQDMKNQFVTVLNLALEERKYKVASHIATDLRQISQRLGELHAGPRDVIHLYRSALQEVTLNSLPEKAHAYLDEGRLLVLRLMGDVLSYYRVHSLKRSSPLFSSTAHTATTRLRGV